MNCNSDRNCDYDSDFDFDFFFYVQVFTIVLVKGLCFFLIMIAIVMLGEFYIYKIIDYQSLNQ